MNIRITEMRVIQISLAIIFVALGIIAALINFNFQVASDQRLQTLELTRAIHHADSLNSNQSEALINKTLHKIQQIANNQRNNTKALSNLILANQVIIKDNQKAIKNTTATNLANTYVNKRNIQDLIDSVKTFNLTQVKQSQTAELNNLNAINLKLENMSKLLTK